MPTRIFHIGMPKAGSTTLQRHIIGTGQVRYLGKNPYLTPDHAYLIRTLLPFADLRFLAETERRRYAALIPPGSFVSDEIMSGIGFMHSLAANSLLQIIDNIDRITDGDYQALMILRRPEDLLASYYAQLVKMEARLSYDQFCSLVLLRRHSWVFRALDYAAILRSAPYASGKLRLFLFEDLFAGPQGWAGFLTACGLDTVPQAMESYQVSPNDDHIDAMAADNLYNPGLNTDLTVLQPSLQEFMTMGNLNVSEQTLHQPLWSLAQQELHAVRSAVAADRAARPSIVSAHRRRRSVIAEHLMSEIFAVNAGLVSVPDLDFERHGYFRLDPLRARE